MTKEQIAAMLGRPLTTLEVTNFDEYLEAAIESVESLLCFSITEEEATYTFKARGGYSTVFTPVYTSIGEVRLNGSVTTDFTSYFFDDLNKDFYNSLVFDNQLCSGDTVEVTAEWGFESIPLDLQQLIAKFFNLVSSGVKADTGVQSKQVEDFRITFNTDASAEERLIDANASTINKYSLCKVGNVQHGKVCEPWI